MNGKCEANEDVWKEIFFKRRERKESAKPEFRLRRRKKTIKK
jgi:hypothetical protein